jgi:aspartate carbamoyltransferase regulatory subunit
MVIVTSTPAATKIDHFRADLNITILTCFKLRDSRSNQSIILVLIQTDQEFELTNEFGPAGALQAWQ